MFRHLQISWQHASFRFIVVHRARPSAVTNCSPPAPARPAQRARSSAEVSCQAPTFGSALPPFSPPKAATCEPR
eukprot:3920270-Pyramimonas_sp.AAC.1